MAAQVVSQVQEFQLSSGGKSLTPPNDRRAEGSVACAERHLFVVLMNTPMSDRPCVFVEKARTPAGVSHLGSCRRDHERSSV